MVKTASVEAAGRKRQRKTEKSEYRAILKVEDRWERDKISADG